MIRYWHFCLSPWILCMILSSCTSMNAPTTKRALCNTLKSHLVFNGGTSNTRQAEMQNAEEPLQQYMYDSTECD